jgi:hypothetical protein
MELQERVRQFTLDTLEAMGLSLDVNIDDTPDGIRVEISGEGGETLLRRRAEALDEPRPHFVFLVGTGPVGHGDEPNGVAEDLAHRRDFLQLRHGVGHPDAVKPRGLEVQPGCVHAVDVAVNIDDRIGQG